MPSTTKNSSKSNAFLARVARARSPKTLTALLQSATQGATNPKTVRRRRRAARAKLGKFVSSAN